MRRLAVYFSDDILMEEIASMARDHGFHLRHVNGMTVCDRVPNIVAREHPDNLIVIERRSKR